MSFDTPRDEPEYGATICLCGGYRQTLTKEMIVAAIRRRFPHYSRKIVSEVVEMSFEEIMVSLVADGSAKLHGFGKFVVRQKSKRAGRNPRTGAKLCIAAHKVVAFKASPNLSAAINTS
jgi:integration host factor subunit alpha